MPTLKERLTSRVEITETCWNWTGCIDKSVGYGVLNVNGKKCYTHRISYQLFRGDIPYGLHVCHTCDNKACVRPDHLFLGTNSDNQRDKVAKGRHMRGERYGRAKLTDSLVKTIRERLESGALQDELADEFGLNQSTISRLKTRKRWIHI